MIIIEWLYQKINIHIVKNSFYILRFKILSFEMQV
jgi:hypothetical protein